MISLIDEWCAAQLDRPTRAEPLRRFAIIVLKAEAS
jgi:hypothetical protein